ncbi:MAG: hypothetical protein JSR33_10400 [Proteobacteria bacterium]|nr:hypothetical protein [Pseudomonadota bacterium]
MGLRDDEFSELNSKIEIDKEPDFKTRKEKAEIERLEHENSVNKENQQARKEYLKKTFDFVRIYIGIVILIFIIYQFGFAPFIKRPMPTMPIVTLLSTTTVNIIGLLVIGFNYLFSNHKK